MKGGEKNAGRYLNNGDSRLNTNRAIGDVGCEHLLWIHSLWCRDSTIIGVNTWKSKLCVDYHN